MPRSPRESLEDAALKACQAGAQLHLALASGRLRRDVLASVENLLREAQRSVREVLDPPLDRGRIRLQDGELPQ